MVSPAHLSPGRNPEDPKGGLVTAAPFTPGKSGIGCHPGLERSGTWVTAFERSEARGSERSGDSLFDPLRGRGDAVAFSLRRSAGRGAAVASGYGCV
jgi:hypothetical protein